MDKVREVIAYQDHFENFLKKQPVKVQNKIYKIIEAIETLERVPKTYLKLIKTKGYMKPGSVGIKYLESILFF